MQLFRMKATMQDNMIELYAIIGIMLNKSLRIIVLTCNNLFTLIKINNAANIAHSLPISIIPINFNNH
jgi:hypothetical protein